MKEKYYQEVLDLKKGVHDLRRELERKGDEVLAIRREANSQLRWDKLRTTSILVGIHI